jgi:hypothetical protein
MESNQNQPAKKSYPQAGFYPIQPEPQVLEELNLTKIPPPLKRRPAALGVKPAPAAPPPANAAGDVDSDDDMPAIIIPPLDGSVVTLDGLGKWLYNAINGLKPFVESLFFGCLTEAIIAAQQVLISGQKFTFDTVWIAVVVAVGNYLTSKFRHLKAKVNGQTARAAVKYVKGNSNRMRQSGRGFGLKQRDSTHQLAGKIDQAVLRVNRTFSKKIRT